MREGAEAVSPPGQSKPRDPLGTSMKRHNDPLGLMLSGWGDAARSIGAGGLPVFAKPKIAGPLLLAPAAALGLGEAGCAWALTSMVAAPTLWAIAHPASFHANVPSALSAYWRRKTVYERDWQRVMTFHGLMKRDGTEVQVPKIKRVARSEFFDHVTIELLPGQSLLQYADTGSVLARSFKTRVCRVHEVEKKPNRLRLDFQRKDALEPVVDPAPLPIDEPVNLEAIPVGLTEYGTPWELRLLGTHILVGGSTGAGKSSVLWSIVRALGPAVRDGLVELWGIDPKDGQELIHGREMFTRYEGEQSDIPQMVQMLRELAAIMRERSGRLAHLKRRKHVATVDDPLIVCIIDELSDITTYGVSQGERKLRDEANGLLAQIARRARSVGITLLLFQQDPRKDGCPFRDQIPHGIGLRLGARFQVDAILGEGAFAHGADCLGIRGEPEPGQPIDGRGVAYVTRLGDPTPLRVRASLVTDEDIAAMAADYPAFDRENAPRPSVGVLSDAEVKALEQEFAVDNGLEDG